MDPAGTTALVTGVGNPDGIGYTTALRLAKRGADVAVTDVTVTPGLEQLAAAIETLGRRGLPLAVDVTEPDQITTCVAHCADVLGSPGVLVNNTGSTVGAPPYLDIEADHRDLSFAINLKGPALFCSAVLPLMVAAGVGSIVNNASTGGLGAEAGVSPCAAPAPPQRLPRPSPTSLRPRRPTSQAQRSRSRAARPRGCEL